MMILRETSEFKVTTVLLIRCTLLGMDMQFFFFSLDLSLWQLIYRNTILHISAKFGMKAF